MPGHSAPDLAAMPTPKDAAWLRNHFKSLTENEATALVQLLTKRTDDVLDAWRKAPDDIVQGAMVYHESACSSCHTLNGEGGNDGPSLNGLRLRHDREWVKAHFADPDKLSPGSEMPPFNFKPQELEQITSYIMSIPK